MNPAPTNTELQPQAPNGAETQQQFPGYLGFLQVFRGQYPNAPADIQQMAQRVFDHINALFQSGPNAWHPAAQSYDYGQFLRDVAVAAAAKGEAVGKAVGETAQKIKRPETTPTTGPQ